MLHGAINRNTSHNNGAGASSGKLVGIAFERIMNLCCPLSPGPLLELIEPYIVLGFVKLVSLAFAGHHLKVVMMRGLIQQALQVEDWKKKTKKDFCDSKLVSPQM
jgi:hypothetical protein